MNCDQTEKILLFFCINLLSAIYLGDEANYTTFKFFLDKTANSKMAPVVISPSGKHTGTLIFCHGLGDTGHGWASTLADVRQSHVKIICPTAETMPVTLNSGKISIELY